MDDMQTLRSLVLFAAALVSITCTLPLRAQAAPAEPPAPVGPANADDLIWQKAVAKFDAPRAALVADVDRVDKQGPFAPNWASLEHYQIPAWYQDAKFGIFIHWGAYAVPAFGSEWYPRDMYRQGSKEYQHQVATHGPETQFGYKDYLPLFKAEHFDAGAWAALFKESGARYVIPVAEHHDGFAMYDSKLSDWTVTKMGPKRDTLGELRTAILANGMHFGASSHRAEHYFFMNGGRAFPSDVKDPKYAAFYGPAHIGIDPNADQKPGQPSPQLGHPDPAYLNDWLARSAELVEKYKPELIYFDWWIEQAEWRPYLERFAAFYYNQAAAQGKQVVLFRKNHAFPDGTTVLDIERGQQDHILPVHWQTDTSVSEKSWGYVEGDTYKSADQILGQLIDIVSKNGNLLLNIGPRADGTIPTPVQQILRSLGGWLKVNGEAIYGTRPWTSYGEGPTKVVPGSFNDVKVQPYTAQDFRFTTRGSTLYAIALGWPSSGEYTVQSLNEGIHVKNVELLGATKGVSWQQRSDGLHIHVSGEAPAGLHAYTFRVTQ